MNPVLIDTSVTIAWLLPDEPWHRQAVALRREIVAGAIAPVVAGHHAFEARHALVRAAQRGRIAWPAIPGHLEAIDEMRLEVAVADDADTVALGLCRVLRLTWGDSQWVALAVRLAVPLVTADLRLARAVPPDLAWVESLQDRPV